LLQFSAQVARPAASARTESHQIKKNEMIMGTERAKQDGSVVVLPDGGSSRPQILTAQAAQHESPSPTAAVAWLGLHLLAQNGTQPNRSTWTLHFG
jgi:hypothetical protein